MADQVAVVTLVTGAPWQQLAELTLPSLRAYAARLRADFVIIDKAIHPHPHYDKWQIYDLLGKYDRIIYLDVDMIVRPDCPDLFVMVAPQYFAGENELASFPGQARHLQRFCQLMGMPPLPCPYYVNGGMFVASRRHRSLFRPPEKVLTEIPWPEQNHLNARLIGEKHEVVLLPRAFNDRSRQGDYLRNSFILHYSVMQRDERMSAIRRDLATWDRMFRREEVSVPAAPSAPAPTGQTPAATPNASTDTDYVAPGLAAVRPDPYFPNLSLGDKPNCTWPYLRRHIPHNWYVDRRSPQVGFLNRDEAHILYNTALKFRGQPALEIGCWMGWSACHMALAGVQLDVIDPLLGQEMIGPSVVKSLEAAGVRESVNLITGPSPDKVHELARQHNRKWALFFIDGNHDAPGPRLDAVACEGYAPENALMLFHDLASPEVAEGLEYLRQRGWNTVLYQTMQIMGAAWRGTARPIEHFPDPSVMWDLPAHLRHYRISGWSDGNQPMQDKEEFSRLVSAVRPFTSMSDRRLLALYTLARHVCLKNVAGSFVECGSGRGGSTALLASVLKTCGGTRKLYGFDTFDDAPPAPQEIDRPRMVGADAPTVAPLSENLSVIAGRLDVTESVTPIKGSLSQTLPRWANEAGPIALLHLNTGLHESTTQALRQLYDRVVPGGIVQISDFGQWEGVQKALVEFVRQRKIALVVQPIDQGGIWFRKALL